MSEEKDNIENKAKFQKEIEDALSMNLDSIEFEDPDSSWSPFSVPVKQNLYRISDQDRDVLFEKISFWIFNVLDLPYEERNTNEDRGCLYLASRKPIEECKDEDFSRADTINLDDKTIQFNTVYDIEAIFMSQLESFNHNLQSIIKCIHNNSQTFITNYAKRKQLYCSNKEEEIICIRNLINDLKKFTYNNEIQLIPTPNLYVTTTYERFIVQDGDDIHTVHKMSKEEKEATVYYGISKKTSDNFTKVLIRLFENRIAIFSPNTATANILGNEQDLRIKCKIDNDEIKSYFLKLTQNNEHGQQIMSEGDIDYLLCVNFKGFEQKKEVKKFIPNINQANLQHFVYQFYSKYSKSVHEAIVYGHFLKNNFTLFEESTIKTITDNFSRRPKKFPSNLDIN